MRHTELKSLTDLTGKNLKPSSAGNWNDYPLPFRYVGTIHALLQWPRKLIKYICSLTYDNYFNQYYSGSVMNICYCYHLKIYYSQCLRIHSIEAKPA